MAAQQFDLDNLQDVLPLSRLIISYPNHQHGNPRPGIDDLNDTVLELFFTRLVQWRYLVTCKCVSKRWNSIISNPDFARYLSNKHFPLTLILRDGGGHHHCLITEHPYFQTHKLHLDDIIPDEIVANHNDILVVCRAPSSRQLAYNVTNPLTKQFIVVPAVPYDNLQYRVYYKYAIVGFAGFVDGVSTFDDVPNSKNNFMGFRIIRVIVTYPNNNLMWHIYSSETGKWKTYTVNYSGFKFEIHNRLGQHEQAAVTLNNKVHYRGLFNKLLVTDPFVDDKVSYCVLNLPNVIHQDSVLGSCRNQLRIAQFESNSADPRIKVWEFDDSDDLINRVDTSNTMAELTLVINFALTPRLIEGNCRLNEVICCHPNDPDIVYVIYNDQLLECNVVNNKLRLIRHRTVTWPKILMLLHPLMVP